MSKKVANVHPFFGETTILFPVLLLVGMGIVMVYSASSSLAVSRFGDNFFYMQRQAVFALLSFGVMFTAASFPYRAFRVFAYFFMGLAVVLLVAVQVPFFGHAAGGAHRWVTFGGFTFQPSEFTKLALVLFLAYSLSKKQEMIRDFSVGFMPHVLLLAVLSILILMQPDFGTVIIIGCITWGMMFVAGVRIVHLLLPVPFLAPVVYFLVYRVDYRMDRILAFMNPWDDPLDKGYQITHSLKAFGSGGIFGKGIGLGMQKLHYLPEPHTDFILSVIGEELGLVGVLTTLVLYSIILWRGAVIARNAPDLFGSFVATGVVITLGLQVAINAGVAMGVLPTKGLTLPFLSYGGTSLIVNMAFMGILMNIGAKVENG
ncbi:MAG: putative lipid II flippase FtsW [Desulfobacterium sp.]|jgi:cell division protein FtsW|nr:putative lipid II flippase FtsW [Desulfobacterium sp.]